MYSNIAIMQIAEFNSMLKNEDIISVYEVKFYAFHKLIPLRVSSNAVGVAYCNTPNFL